MDHEQARRFEKQLAEKEAATHAHAGPTLYGRECPRCGSTSGVHTCGNIQSAAVAEQYCDDPCANPYRPPTVLERIEKELSAHAQESRRVVKLEALHQLLAANPDVARILELKAELGL